jgi:hypothetical protein
MVLLFLNKKIWGGGLYKDIWVGRFKLFIMFSSNKKYKWLTFIFKYGEDDYVKY